MYKGERKRYCQRVNVYVSGTRDQCPLADVFLTVQTPKTYPLLPLRANSSTCNGDKDWVESDESKLSEACPSMGKRKVYAASIDTGGISNGRTFAAQIDDDSLGKFLLSKPWSHGNPVVILPGYLDHSC